MSLFSKRPGEEGETVKDLMDSYGGNVDIEGKETELVKELSNIFSRMDIAISIRESKAKSKVDAYTDYLIQTLLTDDTVIKVIKGSNNTAKNIARFFAGKFRRR